MYGVSFTGPNVTFMLMAEVCATLPASQFWSAVFFLMMFLIAFGNQVGLQNQLQHYFCLGI